MEGARETSRHLSTVSMCAHGTCQPCEHATTWYLDQTVPHCKGQGRPDIVILNEEAKIAYLVDVTVPWGSEENLKASRERKVEKYSGTKKCFEQKGFEGFLRVSLSDPSEHGTR